MNYHEPMDEAAVNAMSSLALAHVGDGVYELMVRTKLAREGGLRQDTLHRATVRYVSAVAQSKAAAHILPLLSDAERGVYTRARNAHSHSSPSGCTPAQYHAATGLEALFGRLWLTGQTARLGEIFAACMEAIDAA